MKKLALMTFGALVAAGAALADPVEGSWKTQPDNNGNYGVVKMYACGSAICGQLVKAYDASGNAVSSDNVNKRIVWDMAPQGGGAYGNGKVYAPDTGKTYSGKMALSGNTLKVSGCVLGICRGQNWSRQ